MPHAGAARPRTGLPRTSRSETIRGGARAEAMTSWNSDPELLKLLVSDRAALIEHLAALDQVPLLLVYTHLSGDESLLDKFRPHIHGAWSFEVDVPEALQAELRERLIATLEDYAANARPLPPAPPPDRL